MVGTFKGFPRLCPWMMRRCRKGGASIRWEVESRCVNYGGVWTRKHCSFHPGLCIFHSMYMTCLVSEWHTASMAKARSVQLLWSRWVWQHLHGRVSGWCWRGLVASTDRWISWLWQCRVSIYCETFVGNRCNSVFSSLELMLPQIFIFLIPCKVFETAIYVGMVDWCPVAWTECVARMPGTISATCRLTSLAQRTGCWHWDGPHPALKEITVTTFPWEKKMDVSENVCDGLDNTWTIEAIHLFLGTISDMRIERWKLFKVNCQPEILAMLKQIHLDDITKVTGQ